MAQVVADVGALSILNKTIGTLPTNSLTLASQYNYQLRLYATNVTPDPNGGDTAGTYTQAAGGGYAAIELAYGSATIANNNPSDIRWAEQTFTFTGALTTNGTIYGYYIVDCNGVLVTSEKAASSFTPATSGDTYKVTPIIKLSYGTPAA